MTVWFVGKGGHDGNSGRTWETRLLTLNGAEDQPVVAGDTVYVGPGAYRELLTVDVSGAAGKPITYIGDVTGEHTDGVGGVVRVTGSNNDQTTARNNAIDLNGGDYRTFRGFRMDLTAQASIQDGQVCDNIIIEDCVLAAAESVSLGYFVWSSTNITVRRCFFLNTVGPGVTFGAGAPQDDSGHIVENCVFLGIRGDGIYISRVGDVNVRNCLFIGCGDDGVDVGLAQNAGHPCIVNNCIFIAMDQSALEATAVADMTENYNTFHNNNTDRTNVNVGAQSQTYPPLLALPILHSGTTQLSGFHLPWTFGELSKWSQVKQITGTNEPEEDLFGIKRPYTHGGPVASLCSWGAVQYHDYGRSIIRAYDGTQSAVVREKNRTWMFVPSISNVQTTITARVYRTAGYGGHRKPAMVIKQPGQADRLTEDAGAAGAWNQLSDTFTPAAQPPWLAVELVNYCDFTTTTTTTVSTTSTTSTTTTTQTVTTTTSTTTTLACDVWFDAIRIT